MDSAAVAKLLQEGLAMHRAGMRREAMETYIKVLREEPQNADALYYVAVLTMQEGQLDEGVRLARRALEFAPAQARLHNLLGQGLHRLGQRLEALASFERAIELQSDLADAHGNRANLLAEMGRPGDALSGFDRALQLRPDSADDWCNRGAALHDLDQLDLALQSYQRAIALRPKFAGAHLNRADILRDLGQMEDASGGGDGTAFSDADAGYAAAIRLDPKLPDGHLGRALLRLLQGDWTAGWADYEYRTRVGPPTFVPLPDPRWRGEPVPGGRLVLVTEQGLGDTIMTCRFAPLLAARGHDVTLLTRQAMQPLLSTLPGVTIATSAEALKADPRPIQWAPLMSLAGLLGITPGTIPAEAPYLKAEPARIAAWAERLRDGFKIGINWFTGHPNDRRRRDIPLAEFAPLAALPAVRLISLQKGPAAEQIAQVAFRDRIETIDADPHPDAGFFLDTAAAMMQLDLVVSCDTSVAHLAGALARPVFTVLPMIADWRWLLGRDDTPWYPTMRLFRQGRRKDWKDTMARIAAAAGEMSRP